MIYLDYIIAAIYLAALFITKKREYLTCLLFFVLTLCVSTLLINDRFSWFTNGIECLYFLVVSAVWIWCASILSGKNNKVSLCVLFMGFYEFICAAESFVWQFVTPVVTPVIINYSFNVMVFHAIIIMGIGRWGVKVERNISNTFHNFNIFIYSQYHNKDKKRVTG